MIEKIKHIFIKETSGDLQVLKQELDASANEGLCSSTIEKVYRCMHTIKGSGPMFGYAHLPEITLPVEKVYRDLSNGNLELNNQIIDKTKDVVTLIQEVLDMDDAHLPNLEEEKQMLIRFFDDIKRLNNLTND